MPEMHITIAILALTFGLLIFTKLPPVSIFVGALTLTITFGLAPLEESLKGFSNPGVLTIGSLFMIAAGMYSTGAINIISDKLIGRPTTLLRAQAAVDALSLDDADEQVGVKIVSKALEGPLTQIAVNAGMEGGVVVEKVRHLEGPVGLDASTGDYIDLIEMSLWLDRSGAPS